MIEFALSLHITFFLIVCLAFVSWREASFFHPLCLYLAFHLLVFVIRPLMVHFLDFNFIWRYMEYTASPDEFVNTLWVSSIGLLVFAVTIKFAGQCPVRFGVDGLPEWTGPEKRAFTAVALLLGPVGLYSASISAGGTSFSGDGDVQMTRDLATGIAIYTNTTGYIAQAHSMVGAICILALWRFNFRWWAYMPLVMFIAYRAFLGWGRWGIITAFLSLLLIYLYRHNRRWMKVRYLILAIPVAILFQSLGMNRDLVRDYVTGGTEVTNRVAEAPEYVESDAFIDQLDHPDFANFEFLAYVLWVVPDRSQTYTYFTQYLQLFTEPIPRILWKEKPIGLPIRLINLNDYGNFVGMTVSLVGDGWMSLGWLGLIITMAMVALILGQIHRAFWRNQHNPRVVMAYCIFLPLTIQWYRDGGISIAKFTLFALFPIILWIILSKAIASLEQRYKPRFKARHY